jgi:predicted ArsR family transcriptional regulator
MEVLGFPPKSPASIALQHLRREGQATIKELEEVLGVSTTAVREHLIHLQSQGFVSTSTVRYGPGRPRLVFHLTEKAHRLFPKQYDLLINLLLQEISAEDGVDKVERLLTRVGTRLATEYQDRISSEDIADRLSELRATLEDRGIDAEIHASGSSIKIFSCPYFDVAQKHNAVCAMERQMFEQVVGEKVTQAYSIREGQHYHCCFYIRQQAEQQPSPSLSDDSEQTTRNT